ncbi:MAG: hypothetical protein N3E48_03050 [Candidatus Bathyarchaeota archaeon]|nr:hypothetical protein [Candidatus Bathyarchaeota archaeon]
MVDEKEYVMVHVKLRRDLYEKLWQETSKRFVIPTKKFHVVLNDIIENYFLKVRGEGG